MKNSKSFRNPILVAVPLVLVSIACSATVPPTQEEEQNEEGDDKPVAKPASDTKPTSDTKGDAGPAAACPYEGPPLTDVSTMAKCRDGGRCVPAVAVPKDQQGQLAKCDNGDFCVAEDLVVYQGLKLLKSCHGIAGGEGRCMSRVFPDIDAQKDRLPQDVCSDSERCAPCYDPGTGAPTPVCKLVSCDAPKEPKKVFAQCCVQGGKANGRCVPKSTMKPAEADQLDQKECTAADVCAPAEQILDPAKLPNKCNGSSIMGAYQGVCLSTCIPRDFLAQIGTSQGNCDSLHFCAPCKNPLTGASTGAPGCAP